MAYWTQEKGWQSYSLPTNAKTDYSGGDLAASFPHATADAYASTYSYRDAASYADDFPANKEVEKTFWVKETLMPVFYKYGIKEVVINEIRWTEPSTKPKDKGWYPKTLSYSDNKLKKTFDFYDDLSSSSQKSMKKERDKLIANSEENATDLERRQTAANTYNQTQTTKRNTEASKYNSSQNKLRQDLANQYNTTNSDFNTKNSAINTWSSATKTKLASAQKGSYAKTLSSLDTDTLNNLVDKGLMTQEETNRYLQTAADTFQSYYDTNKITKFNPKVTCLKEPCGDSTYDPPAGGLARFDPTIYAQTNEGKEDLTRWQEAQNVATIGGRTYPDLDIVGTYGQDTWLQWNYAVKRGKKTTDGKWIVASQTQKAKAAEDYKEEAVTDAQYQQYRDSVMGLSAFTSLKDWEAAQDPEFLRKWITSLSPDDAADRASGYLPIPTQKDIPEAIRDQVKMDKGPTILEGKLSSVLGAKEEEAASKFRSLTIDTFNETLKEYKKQRKKEQDFEIYSGMPGFSEVFNVNQELSNSILGDTGVGGLLSLGGQDQEKATNSLEKQFSAITGIPSRSSTVYNWQKWFDETLTKRYEEGATFTDWEDASKQHAIDKDFAESYVKQYLNPRFNTSRSMSEFMNYIDVEEGEENIFQTQSALSALKMQADIRAEAWLKSIDKMNDSSFDAAFYFDPQGGDTPTEKHLAQKEAVQTAWDLVNTPEGREQKVPGQDYTWDQLAYYYGYDLTDKAQFAKLHYQTYGVDQGFDPAKDALSLADAQAYIDQNILPIIEEQKLNMGNVAFLNFVTPSEYADKMLEGVDPVKNKPEWEKVLQSMGLSGKEMGIEELKTYIEEAFQTGEATKIREGIKYLNEKKESVTQAKLGVDYIQRPEDTAPKTDPGETRLYTAFKDAGFEGTENDFYKEFMPDVNREDMEFLTQASKGLKEGGVFSGLTSSDPFEALGSVEGLFADEDTSSKTSSETSSSTKEKSYFNFSDDDDDDTTTPKSNAGQSFLGSFASAFKNLTPKY
jgi:hypothetical protein